MSVEGADKMEIVPARADVIKTVAPIAKVEDRSDISDQDAKRLITPLSLKLNLPLYSLNTIMPSVANAESHSDISYTEAGLIIQIITTASDRLVSKSRTDAIRYSKDDIISINPARTTDGENPVNAI